MFVGHERQRRPRFEPPGGDMFQARRPASYTAPTELRSGAFRSSLSTNMPFLRNFQRTFRSIDVQIITY